MTTINEPENPLLTRNKPLTHTLTPTLEIRLDPLCSRSYITFATLNKNFSFLLDKTYPHRPPSPSVFPGEKAVKGYDCVILPLEIRDTENKILKVEVEARLCQGLDGVGSMHGKVVLGKDFWGRESVKVCWIVEKKENNGSGWWGKGKNRDDEDFLGMFVGNRRVRFERK